MPSGPYQLALSRATVVTPDATFRNAYIAVRGGVVTVKVGRDVVATAGSAEVPATVTRTSRRAGIVTIDGAEWTFTRDCGCGGR